MHAGTCAPKTALGVFRASAGLLPRSPPGRFCYLQSPAEETKIKCLVRGDKASLWESQKRNPAPSDPGALTYDGENHLTEEKKKSAFL